jgi:MFS family permease
VRGLLIMGMFSTFFIGVLYVEKLRGYGALTTGLAFLPQTALLALMSLGPIAWLVGRIGPRRPVLIGLPCVAGGLILLATAGVHAAYLPTLLGAFLLVGLGAGMCFMPLLVIAMARVPSGDAGLASGITNASLQVSGAIGVAVLGSLSANRTASLEAAGEGVRQAMLGGYHLAFWVALGCAAAALVAAAVWVRAPRPALATALAAEPASP